MSHTRTIRPKDEAHVLEQVKAGETMLALRPLVCIVAGHRITTDGGCMTCTDILRDQGWAAVRDA